MRRIRGVTLIELMVVVALVGISAGTVGMAASHQRLAGLAELQREQAAQLIEYHADCLSTGRRPDAAVTRRLKEGLPSADVRIDRKGRLATITVLWRAMNGLQQKRALSVFVRGGP